MLDECGSDNGKALPLENVIEAPYSFMENL
jgi:hypothetical protein